MFVSSGMGDNKGFRYSMNMAMPWPRKCDLIDVGLECVPILEVGEIFFSSCVPGR